MKTQLKRLVFFEKLRVDSVENLSIFAKIKGVTVGEANYDTLPFNQRMAFITLSGRECRMVFKLHFSENIAKPIFAKIAPITGLLAETTTSHAAKEYCNIMAGAIRNLGQNYELSLSHTLPIVLLGFNEFIFRESSYNDVYDTWRLLYADGFMDCSIQVRLPNAELMARLDTDIKEKLEIKRVELL